jgi:hypothetical protein
VEVIMNGPASAAEDALAARMAGDVDLVELPRVTTAAPDLNCWIWAATPQYRGKINITRAADRFGVSRTTMRRWLNQPGRHQLTSKQIIRAQQLAILRGRGTILWPDLDPGSRRRLDHAHRNAEQAAQVIADQPELIPPDWTTNHTLDSHSVLLIWWPYARAYSITTTRSGKTLAKIQSARYLGEIVQQVATPNRYAADVIKYQTLINYSEFLCITPRALIPFGRTEALRANVKSPELIVQTR